MKYKVTFLLDQSNLWFEKIIKNYDFKLKSKYLFKFSKNISNIKNQDIVFPLSYTKILTEDFLKKNNLVLIAHPSKLPRDKGFAPIQYEILKKKKLFYISLIKAEKHVDAGPICLQHSFKLNGKELYDEIRNIQGIQILKIIKKFLRKYPNVKFKKQKGKSTFNKKRYPKDSELDINKTIKEQFNLMRINSNDLYPSFFYFKDQKYIIKIFKE